MLADFPRSLGTCDPTMWMQLCDGLCASLLFFEAMQPLNSC